MKREEVLLDVVRSPGEITLNNDAKMSCPDLRIWSVQNESRSIWEHFARHYTHRLLNDLDAMMFRGWFKVFGAAEGVVLQHRQTGMYLVHPTIYDVLVFLDVMDVAVTQLPVCALHEIPADHAGG